VQQELTTSDHRSDPWTQPRRKTDLDGSFVRTRNLARANKFTLFITLFSAWLILLLGAIVRPVQAALQLSVGIPGLQHFDSDGGVDLDFGLTDQNGAPVASLKEGDVKVFEDGVQARIVKFRGLGQGRPVDIVFVVDITESMQPYIDAVKENMIAFAHELAANHRDYRLGLVTFEDYVVSAYEDCGCPYRNQMTSDVQEFIKWVGTLHAGGGGDIPEDQLDALAYAATLPFRPAAQGILILITDAPDHHAGDGSAYTQHDAAYWAHHKPGTDVTDLTADKVAEILKRQGLTLYAVVPPPFIAPDYALLVRETHGREYNIVTEENRFPELVREIGHTIATQYSLTYITPRPIEDGTTREVTIEVDYGGQSVTATTSYHVRGVGGARINVPELGASNTASVSSPQLFFAWWNLAVPMLALLGLFVLSRARFGVPEAELQAALSPAQEGSLSAPIRQLFAQTARSTSEPRRAAAPATPSAAPGRARLVALNAPDSVASEYIIDKPEISVGRGDSNDFIIPHPSVSRSHALIRRRDGVYEVTDLNSTNGTYVDDRRVTGTAVLVDGSQVRFGEVAFVLRA